MRFTLIPKGSTANIDRRVQSALADCRLFWNWRVFVLHEQPAVGIGQYAQVIPDHSHPLEPKSIRVGGQPKGVLEKRLLRQDIDQMRIAGSNIGSQPRRLPDPSQRHFPVRQHTGAAKAQLRLVAVLLQKPQFLAEQIVAESAWGPNRQMRHQIILRPIQAVGKIASAGHHIRPLARSLQGDRQIRFAAGQIRQSG